MDVEAFQLHFNSKPDCVPSAQSCLTSRFGGSDLADLMIHHGTKPLPRQYVWKGRDRFCSSQSLKCIEKRWKAKHKQLAGY